MLGVLDAKAPLAHIRDRFENLEDFVVGAISDRMNRDLKVVRVGVGDRALHPAISHRLHRQSAILRIIGEWLEHRCGR